MFGSRKRRRDKCAGCHDSDGRVETCLKKDGLRMLLDVLPYGGGVKEDRLAHVRANIAPVQSGRRIAMLGGTFYRNDGVVEG